MVLPIFVLGLHGTGADELAARLVAHPDVAGVIDGADARTPGVTHWGDDGMLCESLFFSHFARAWDWDDYTQRRQAVTAFLDSAYGRRLAPRPDGLNRIRRALSPGHAFAAAMRDLADRQGAGAWVERSAAHGRHAAEIAAALPAARFVAVHRSTASLWDARRQSALPTPSLLDHVTPHVVPGHSDPRASQIGAALDHRQPGGSNRRQPSARPPRKHSGARHHRIFAGVLPTLRRAGAIFRLAAANAYDRHLVDALALAYPDRVLRLEGADFGPGDAEAALHALSTANGTANSTAHRVRAPARTVCATPQAATDHGRTWTDPAEQSMGQGRDQTPGQTMGRAIDQILLHTSGHTREQALIAAADRLCMALPLPLLARLCDPARRGRITFPAWVWPEPGARPLSFPSGARHGAAHLPAP